MTPPDRADGEHFNPLLVTVLPEERRARHAYQLCVMLALITTAGSQLILGAQAGSAITELPHGQQDMLNWFALLAGCVGVLVAVIPERIVRWRLRVRGRLLGVDFDATWIRLATELGCHGLLAFVWLSYLVTVSMRLPFLQGLSVASGLTFWLMVAALWRCAQILADVKAATVDHDGRSVIVGADQGGGGG